MAKKSVRKVTPAYAATTMRQALNVCQQVLLLDNAESGKLWDVLSALRGPDASGLNGGSLKGRSTSVIRARAFPLVAKLKRKYGGGMIPAHFAERGKIIWGEEGYGPDHTPKFFYKHFSNHINNAAKALRINPKQRLGVLNVPI